MTTLYFIRHGDTPAVGHFIAGRAPGVLLNDRGRAQVEELADRLAAEPIRAIYSSPLERTRETAGPLARRLGLEVRAADELIELDFGEWTGKGFAELDPLPEWRRYNAHRSGTRIPGGELMLEVQARAVAFAQRVCEEWPGAAVALVSHGDVIRAALLHYLGMPLDFYHRIEISPASVSAVALGEYGAQVLSLNATGPKPA
jgi:probable phosphoglycerate mutase